MKLIVLGNQGPFPGAGGACSGYLVTQSNTQLLLDCGSGVLANLQKVTAFKNLSGIILSHLHSDHMSDMLVLIYALQLKRKRGEFEGNIKVYLPDSPAEVYNKLAEADVFECVSVKNNDKVRIGDLDIVFREMTHPIKTMAVSISDAEKKFVFSGDTSYNEELAGFAKNADLLLLDSGLLNSEKTDKAAHMTAGECGEIAALAEAKRLLLTHIWPENSPDRYISEAKEKYKNAEAAIILNSYEI